METKAVLRAMKLYPVPFVVQYGIMAFGAPIIISSRYHTYTALDAIVMGTALASIYLYTFLLNSITDAREDSSKGVNPFSEGTLKASNGMRMVYALGAVAFLSSLLSVIVSPWGAALLLAGLLMGTVYSTGPRFKESTVGPVIASLFHIGPALLFTLIVPGGVPPENLAVVVVYWLALLPYALFLEVDHTVRDWPYDSQAGVMTLAVRMGVERAAALRDLLAIVHISMASFFVLALASTPWAVSIIGMASILYLTDRVSTRVYNAGVLCALLIPPDVSPVTVLALILALPELAFIGFESAVALRHYCIKSKSVALQAVRKSRSSFNERIRKKMVRIMIRF